MDGLTMSVPNILPNTTEKLSIEFLRFDPENPRFASDANMKGVNDVEVIKELMRIADLGEVIQSIAANGYIDIEPLVVTRHEEVYTVLEGNRRLAALRLLKDPDLAHKCDMTQPQLSEGVRSTFDQVTVYVVTDRTDAADFIGFKHINGPHRWDALAKARFAADWYHRERDNGITLRDIARRLGDTHNTVKRLVNGIFVLEQAQKNRVFDPHDRYPGRPFAFSHLYTALTNPRYQQFLGLPEDWIKGDPILDPVPKERLENLGEILTWLYGSKEDNIRPIVISQNPHVKMLGEILQKPIALRTLRVDPNLQEAYKLVRTHAVQFEEALLNALKFSADALAKISSFEGDDETLLEVANQLRRTTQIIYVTMKAAPTIQTDEIETDEVC